MERSCQLNPFYRDAARFKYRHDPNIQVSPDAAVIPMADGGAFVEAMIWVSTADQAAAQESEETISAS